MAYKLQLKRGLLSALPIGISGEPLFTTDTNDLYISNGTTNQKFQKFIASGTSSQFLKGDGSLDSTTYQPLLTNPVTGTGTTNYLSKWTSGSAIGNSLVFDNGTNVGIGTASPDSKFHIAPSNGVQIRFDYVGSGDNYYDGVTHYFRNGNGAANVMTLKESANVLIGSTTDNGNRLQVTGSGYFSGSVGIGTASPGYKIDVESGSGLIETIRIKNGYTSGSDGSQLLLGNSANFTNAFFRLNGGGNTSQAGAGSLNIGIVESSPIAFYTANTERMRLTSTGAATFSSSVTAQAFIPSYNTSYYTTDGRISNYSASNYLYVNGNAGGGLFLKGEGDGTNNIRIESSTLNLISFQTNGSERLRITSGGNLLVGTTTDSGEKLVVSGSVLATSFIKSGGTSSQYLMADGSVTTGGGGGSVDELQVALICQVFG